MSLFPLNTSEKFVLRAVHSHGAVTRQQIATALGVSKMQATNIVKSLTEKGLLTETPKNQGLRGQPARALSIHPKGMYTLGVNFTEQHVDTVLMNGVGTIEAKQTFAIEHADVNAIVAHVNAFIGATLSRKRIPAKRLVGVGVSVPGDFIDDRKIIVPTYFPQLTNVNLEAAFQQQLDYPVYIENDSNCAGWGEAMYGRGKALKHFLYINIGYGIGGGIIIHQRLYRGAHGNAGIFGTPFPDRNAPRPSGSDLLATLQQHAIDVSSFHQLEHLPVAETPAVQGWLQRAAAQLRQPLYVLARAFDPEAIIIGGRLPIAYYDYLVTQIDDGSIFQSDWGPTPQPQLLSTSLGDLAGVVGSCSLCYTQLFD
ncbi:ROK family transcriptional regulator [Pseudidiomarina sediminum]|uniref:ROK family transcriptional regulator n=1 Tax=Pseudidiomarina sediminum TaxID=431675 RepID=UPI001FD0BAE6|nr:ROK family transcriptional regulator [Pseudidiomarina sediminum]